MKHPLNNHGLTPRDWGLEVSSSGEMLVAGLSCVQLAKTCGTPVHVVNEAVLIQTAEAFLQAFRARYTGEVSVHYAFKCNPVAGVIAALKEAGLKAEVMSAFELFLAHKLGFRGSEIIVNGPLKPDAFLSACLHHEVQYIVADSMDELRRLDRLARQQDRNAAVLLRINPDIIPAGMNKGTATGSRRGCALGLDLKGGEARNALALLPELKNIIFEGFHFHIGSGIHHPGDYRRALRRMKVLVEQAFASGLAIHTMDIGGGFAAPLSREMTTREILVYQGLDRLPAFVPDPDRGTFEAFAQRITQGMESIFGGRTMPELVCEPGRSITGPNQFLLLKVHQVKERAGVRKWVTTDGGIGTVTMPTLYEFHEVFLCNDIRRPRNQRITINGPGCFAADVVYRNKRMPEITEGEVIAVMDSGAYFTSWESAFGHPRPAVVMVKNGKCRTLRRRETFDEMLSRDVSLSKNQPAAPVMDNLNQPVVDDR
jgi:diaminopimelate decarboxylase